MTKNKHTPKTKWWLSVISTLVNAPLPMPMITKAATPLRMPRYLTPNTTWYKKRAMRQLSPMLASPKKVRNTVNRKQGHLSALGQLYCKKRSIERKLRGRMRRRSYQRRRWGRRQAVWCRRRWWRPTSCRCGTCVSPRCQTAPCRHTEPSPDWSKGGRRETEMWPQRRRL